MGHLHGLAEITHRNGDKFVGNFKNGKKFGKGTVYYSNGSILEGEYHEDRLVGKAVMVYKIRN